MEIVMVERDLAANGLELADLAAQEEKTRWCFETYRVKFLYTFVGKAGERMTCVYEAPDAEAVRNTQDTAGLPYERIWTAMQVPAEQVSALLQRAAASRDSAAPEPSTA